MGSREDNVHLKEKRSIITSTTGGVMPKEVGAVTVDLEVAKCPHAAEGIGVVVRYVGADERYTVEGSPTEPDNASDLTASELRNLHERVVRNLTTPGTIVEGNE